VLARGAVGRHQAPGRGPAPGRSGGPGAEARERDRESLALRIASAFLRLVGVLGLGLTAAGVYLRGRELEGERAARRLRRDSGPWEE